MLRARTVAVSVRRPRHQPVYVYIYVIEVVFNRGLEDLVNNIVRRDGGQYRLHAAQGQRSMQLSTECGA